MSTPRLFVLKPQVLFRARVNKGGTLTYPIDTIPWQFGTLGTHASLQPGMTLLFGTAEDLDDLGRNRVRKAATATDIYIGRSSRGRGDGEVDLLLEDPLEDVFITGLWDYRVWTKVPATVSAVWYMDSDIAVGTNTTYPPPVANTGPPAMGTVASNGKLRVQFPAAGANSSFATADGATIVGYSWGLPSGVALVSGYTSTDAVIQVDVDPGFYWLSLTVIDSNGQSHLARSWVYARDAAADTTLDHFSLDQSITPTGQRVSIRVLADLPTVGVAAPVSNPDGTLVAVMDGEMSGPGDRSNLRFWGWHQTDPTEMVTLRTGLTRTTTLECVDVAGRLDSLPGFANTVKSNTYRDPEIEPDLTWHHMVNPTLDKYAHYLLHWYSTALEVADWTWSGTGTAYASLRFDSYAKSLWDQVSEMADKMGGYHLLVCNRYGQMGIVPEPLHRSPAYRTTTIQADIEEEDWAEIRYTGQRPPRVHWLWGGGLVADAAPDVDSEGNPILSTVFCKAPGEAPGQGEVEEEINELLVINQAALNAMIGQRYARLNARRGLVQIRLAAGDDLELDPAALTWVRLSVTAATMAQRKLTWASQRGLVREVNMQMEPTRTGLVRTVALTWEEETVGAPAATIEQ